MSRNLAAWHTLFVVEHIKAHTEDRVLRLTLNRPERQNALDPDFALALLRHVANAEEDWRVGAILIDAQGSHFSRGIDLNASCKGEFLQVLERLCTVSHHSSRPIVVAVQGPCLDAALGIVANAHYAVAAQGVQFGLTEIRYGSWPFVAFPAVARAIGNRRAVALSATGRIFSGAEALQFGLIHEIAPAFELDDRATAIARLLANSSQDAMRRGLEFAREQQHMMFDDAARFGGDLLAECCRTPDFLEGVEAMRENRRPDWPSLKSV